MVIKDNCLFDVTEEDIRNIPLDKIFKGVTSIGAGAFVNCKNLESITIPNSVVSIGKFAFAGCTRLTSITIPNKVISIGDCAFSECTSLISITIPESVTSLGWGAFKDCISLKSITLPESVTAIALFTFARCRSLESITLSDRLISIGFNPFANCESLTHIEIIAKTPEEFTRIKMLLPKEQQEKAVNLMQEIQDGLRALTQQEETDEDLETMRTSLSKLHAMIVRAGRAGDSMMIKFYLHTDDLEAIIVSLNQGLIISSDLAFQVMSALFLADFGEPKKKYLAIIHMFKEYDEDLDIRNLLEKSIMSMLNDTKVTSDSKLASQVIDRCLPCSAIIKTIMQSKVIDNGLKKAFKAMSDKLSSMTINQIRTLLGGSPFKEALEEKYGQEQIIVSYESIIMQDSNEPYSPQNTHLAITVDFLQAFEIEKKIVSYDDKIVGIFNQITDLPITDTRAQSPFGKVGIFATSKPQPVSSSIVNNNKAPKPS